MPRHLFLLLPSPLLFPPTTYPHLFYAVIDGIAKTPPAAHPRATDAIDGLLARPTIKQQRFRRLAYSPPPFAPPMPAPPAADHPAAAAREHIPSAAVRLRHEHFSFPSAVRQSNGQATQQPQQMQLLRPSPFLFTPPQLDTHQGRQRTPDGHHDLPRPATHEPRPKHATTDAETADHHRAVEEGRRRKR